MGNLNPQQFGHNHPTEEPVSKILDSYAFSDDPAAGAGRQAWSRVASNYIDGHPGNNTMRNDIARNGIKNPIRIDYHQDPPVVTDGHTRLYHAEKLGIATVPVRHGEFADVHTWEPMGLKTECTRD